MIFELNEEDKLCEIYKAPADQLSGGYYAVRDRSPKFCIHAPSLSGLGTRVQQALKAYEDLTRSRVR